MRKWLLQKPHMWKQGLHHVLNKEAMQIGLRHYIACKGRAPLKRKRR